MRGVSIMRKTILISGRGRCRHSDHRRRGGRRRAAFRSRRPDLCLHSLGRERPSGNRGPPLSRRRAVPLHRARPPCDRLYRHHTGIVQHRRSQGRAGRGHRDQRSLIPPLFAKDWPIPIWGGPIRAAFAEPVHQRGLTALHSKKAGQDETRHDRHRVISLEAIAPIHLQHRSNSARAGPPDGGHDGPSTIKKAHRQTRSQQAAADRQNPYLLCGSPQQSGDAHKRPQCYKGDAIKVGTSPAAQPRLIAFLRDDAEHHRPRSIDHREPKAKQRPHHPTPRAVPGFE
ncbi:unnamed protein product [Acanthosepion pharaonis]|uniref:Uncharacterized protein n=1 Tax=Acanthosepion pharaonis TaxID=158019 RepID=A0A812D8H6_ACAPH|nr:unnamed protein product [Sepia pharaonis]